MRYLSNLQSLSIRWLIARGLLCVAFAIPSRSSSSVSVNVCKPYLPLTGGGRKMCSTQACSWPTNYEAGTSSVAFVTTPDKESAKNLARSIIELKLAACVNIVPQIESIYMWEGKVNEDNEYLLMIKTRTERVDDLTKHVRENHPYSVAEVISLPIENGNTPYLNWIASTVPAKGEENKD
ncbi:protein CutA homolog [Scaptodrosophila lebanonensis]|uniref:Protein CutA homolog n=1 Tax=Drosophila lebanonensis TaxID=7225 RepID=A0A6J2U4K3_DROLE|nr:protein CutA homolog [Scaptodrosophila lebanonensis]